VARGRRSDGAGGDIRDADRIVDAALRLIAGQGWRSVSLAAVAADADMTILQVYRLFPSRTAILCGFFRRVDEAILAPPPEMEPEERPRDRLFELMMRRFDTLQPHRAALLALRRDLPFDPPAAVAAGLALLGSMRLMLDTAGIASHGIAGTIAVKLSAAAYLAALHTWSRDDTPDLAPTMAALDRRLRSIERWLSVAAPRHDTARPAQA
jgi:AcrR family transcriptional regulator